MPECRVFDRSHGKQAFRFLNPKHIDRSDCAKQDNVFNLKKKQTHTHLVFHLGISFCWPHGFSCIVEIL